MRALGTRRDRNRRIFLGLMRSALLEHARDVLVAHPCIPQYLREVRRARRAHRERLRQCGRIGTHDGHQCRVPLQRP